LVLVLVLALGQLLLAAQVQALARELGQLLLAAQVQALARELAGLMPLGSRKLDRRGLVQAVSRLGGLLTTNRATMYSLGDREARRQN